MVNEISKQTVTLEPVKDAVTQVVDNKPAEIDQLDVLEKAKETKESFDELVSETTKQLNIKMQSIERDLQFNVDETSGDTIITVLDTKTSEVIRQIPTEEVLAIRENIETLKGILFSAEV